MCYPRFRKVSVSTRSENLLSSFIKKKEIYVQSRFNTSYLFNFDLNGISRSLLINDHLAPSQNIRREKKEEYSMMSCEFDFYIEKRKCQQHSPPCTGTPCGFTTITTSSSSYAVFKKVRKIFAPIKSSYSLVPSSPSFGAWALI